MKSIKNVFYLGMVLGLLCCAACTADQLSDSSSELSCSDDAVIYDNQIKPLIDTYCNIPECHDDGSSFGDYTTYAKMQSILNESNFQNRVLDKPNGDVQKMPPPYSDGPTEIADADLEFIRCWINQGYPEN